MWRHHEDNIGEFQEREHGKWFTYRPTEDPWAICHGYDMQISVNDVVGNPFRFAKVLKTVAHVIVDEASDGSPVIEKWHFRRHNVWKKQ